MKNLFILLFLTIYIHSEGQNLSQEIKNNINYVCENDSLRVVYQKLKSDVSQKTLFYLDGILVPSSLQISKEKFKTFEVGKEITKDSITVPSILMTTNIPEEIDLLSLYDLNDKYIHSDKNSTIYKFNGNYIGEDIENFRIDKDYILKLEILNSTEFKYLSKDIIFTIVNIISKTPKNIEKDTKTNILIKKPVIYLYPERETIIDITVDFDGEITASYPKCENSNWKVKAYPNGTIKNIKDNREYSYIYWEGDIQINNSLIESEYGYVVSKDSTINFLERILPKYGLNTKEANDFISYWLPDLYENDFNFIQLISNNKCNEIAQMNIIPPPQKEIRLYMLFESCNKSKIAKKPKLPKNTFERNGFVVVEWGGAKIGTGKIE